MKERNRRDKQESIRPDTLPADFFNEVPMEDREAVAHQFNNSTAFRSYLAKYLDHKITTLIESEERPDFGHAAWAEEQANKIGERKGLRTALKLVGGNDAIRLED